MREDYNEVVVKISHASTIKTYITKKINNCEIVDYFECEQQLNALRKQLNMQRDQKNESLQY
jgi:hypothetical protein